MKKGIIEYAKCSNGTMDVMVTEENGNTGNYNYGSLQEVKKDFPKTKYEYINLDR